VAFLPHLWVAGRMVASYIFLERPVDWDATHSLFIVTGTVMPCELGLSTGSILLY